MVPFAFNQYLRIVNESGVQETCSMLKQPPLGECKTHLQEWVSIRGLSAREFTAMLDKKFHPIYISYIISGAKRPSLELAKMIEKATGGDIKAIQMLGLA